MYTYVTMTAGARAGKCFLLDPTDENRIGRGTECDIILTDPLCSRIHAIVVQEEDGWVPPGAKDNPFAVFRAARIAPDHPALAGRTLVPLDPQPTSGIYRP